MDELTGWTNTKALMQNAGVGGESIKISKTLPHKK